jgi:hypothetical protein
VRGQHELRLCRERVRELEVDRAAARREVDQRRVGEANVDPAGERGDGRIGTLDEAVVADGLDLFEVVRPAFSARRTAVSLTPSWRASSRLLLVGASIQPPGSQVLSC